jgi:phage terminase small subunit
MSDVKYPSPPEHLSGRSKELWCEYIGHEIKSPGRITLFQTGLEALDRAEQARLLVEKEGLTTVTGRSGVSHAHPALAIEKEAKSQFVRIWKILGLYFNGRWAKKLSIQEALSGMREDA